MAAPLGMDILSASNLCGKGSGLVQSARKTLKSVMPRDAWQWRGAHLRPVVLGIVDLVFGQRSAPVDATAAPVRDLLLPPLTSYS